MRATWQTFAIQTIPRDVTTRKGKNERSEGATEPETACARQHFASLALNVLIADKKSCRVVVRENAAAQEVDGPHVVVHRKRGPCIHAPETLEVTPREQDDHTFINSSRRITH